MYEQSRKKFWYLDLFGHTMRHDGQDKRISYTWSLGLGQLVGLLVTRDGDLHLFVDGKYREMVWSDVPTDQPLWGVADVHGQCVKIKADLMCGKCIIIIRASLGNLLLVVCLTLVISSNDYNNFFN